MNGMSTGHFVTGRTRREKIFLTDGTIGLVLSVLAIVIVVQSTIDAHAAVVTVLKVFGTADTAKATVLTMVRAFLIGHPQVADVAMVGTKLDVTRNAVVCLAILSCIALSANNLTDRKAINRMMRIFWLLIHVGKGTGQGRRTLVSTTNLLDGNLWRKNWTIIVADATSKGSPAAGGNHCAVSVVMTTLRTCEFRSLGLLVRNRAMISKTTE